MLRHLSLAGHAVLCVGAMLAAAGQAPAAEWRKLTEGVVGRREGAVLVAGPGGKLLWFGGEDAGGGAYLRAFDPAGGAWGDFAAAKPAAQRGIHPGYQAALDPKAGKLYCLTYPGVLYTFDLAAAKWAGPAEVAALDGLSWHAVAIDPEGRKLVVFGADRKADNLGWSRTAVMDLDAGEWSTLPLPAEPIVKRHRQLVAATEAMIDLIGRIRLAWYRDPAGRGSDAERAAIVQQMGQVRKQSAFAEVGSDLDAIASLLSGAKTLDVLHAARAVHRKLDEAAIAQYPVPCSRRNAPLAFDAKGKAFVLFGGDHEDYLLNDTWVLDLAAGAWRRQKPALAPSPRAGHALVSLPKAGRVVLYGGYVQNSSPDYGAGHSRPVEPRQLWAYDPAADRWDLLDSRAVRRDDTSQPPAVETFYSYHAQHFAPPALAATDDGRLVLVTPKSRFGKAPSATWAVQPDLSNADAAGREKLGRPPDQRLYRAGRFLAAYCEVPDPPGETKLDALPANRWVRMPPVPRNVAYGCRQRDWGTAVWDERNDQVLLWGGGHCVRSSSSVVHYSPVSGRMVESYDADEPYGGNGNGGYGSSLLNRPWAGVHSYNTYAYDPPTGRMISARGFFYDPVRMDWLRREPAERPFRYIWSHTVLEATPHGVVAWAQAEGSERIGLWRYDKLAGWVDLKPVGKLYQPYCDSEGMTYDPKRDRLVLGWGGGYERAGDGSLMTFDFKTRRIEKLTPQAAELGRIRNTREMVYADHADWIAFAEPFFEGDREKAKHFLRIYDCAKDRYFLLDAGDGPGRQFKVHGQGWCWDARRTLLHVITIKGGTWALRLDPAAAKLLDGPA